MKKHLQKSCLDLLKLSIIIVAYIFCVNWLNYYSEALLIGNFGSSITRWLFACIGTPVHEISHAIVAIIFGFQIIEFRPLILDPNSSTLGYVTYAYDRTSLFQQTGHFFVGIAPIVFQLVIIYGLYRLLIPHKTKGKKLEWAKILRPHTLLFVYLVMQITLHMRLSQADLEGALMGIPILIGLLFIISLIWPRFLEALNEQILKLAGITLSLSLAVHLIIRLLVFIL